MHFCLFEQLAKKIDPIHMSFCHDIGELDFVAQR